MQKIDRQDHFVEQLDLLCQRERARRLRQRCSLHVLHDEVRRFLGWSQIVNANDVRMADARQRACFAQKPAAQPGVGRAVGIQDLDRDLTAERFIARHVDAAHSARADFPHDPETGQALGRRRGGFGRAERLDLGAQLGRHIRVARAQGIELDGLAAVVVIHELGHRRRDLLIALLGRHGSFRFSNSP